MWTNNAQYAQVVLHLLSGENLCTICLQYIGLHSMQCLEHQRLCNAQYVCWFGNIYLLQDRRWNWWLNANITKPLPLLWSWSITGLARILTITVYCSFIQQIYICLILYSMPALFTVCKVCTSVPTWPWQEFLVPFHPFWPFFVLAENAHICLKPAGLASCRWRDVSVHHQ